MFKTPHFEVNLHPSSIWVHWLLEKYDQHRNNSFYSSFPSKKWPTDDAQGIRSLLQAFSEVWRSRYSSQKDDISFPVILEIQNVFGEILNKH